MKKALKNMVKVLVFFLAWAICVSIGEINTDDPAIWRFGAEIFPLLWTLLFTVIFLLLEKGRVKIPVFHNIAKGSLAGFATGVLWIGISAGILLLTGAAQITFNNEVEYRGLWILSAFINTIMQELLVRGYIYQLLKEQYNIILAAIVSTALFTFMHSGAFEAGLIPVLNVITMSLFMTALYEKTETIAAPILAHAVWNIAGAIILGGVSLADDYPSLFTMTSARNVLISGGDYKIEGSIVVLILNILFGLFFWLRLRSKNSVDDSKTIH